MDIEFGLSYSLYDSLKNVLQWRKEQSTYPIIVNLTVLMGSENEVVPLLNIDVLPFKVDANVSFRLRGYKI